MPEGAAGRWVMPLEKRDKINIHCKCPQNATFLFPKSFYMMKAIYETRLFALIKSTRRVWDEKDVLGDYSGCCNL